MTMTTSMSSVYIELGHKIQHAHEMSEKCLTKAKEAKTGKAKEAMEERAHIWGVKKDCYREALDLITEAVSRR